MKFRKSFAPLDTALIVICLIAIGAWFYTNIGSAPTQIAQVTPIAPIQPTATFVSPAVVRSTVVSPLQASDTSNMLASASISPLSVLSSDDAIIVAPDSQEQIVSVPNIPTPHGIPTPIPASGDLGRGESLKLMQEFDQKWDVRPENPLFADEEDVVSIYLSEFFNDDFDPWSGTPPTLTDKLLSLDGKIIEIKGYMAPPLKLGLDWFLLGDAPIGACPFHSTAASITSGIALVYVEGAEHTFSPDPVSVVGELHVGEVTDPETGMVSIARVYTVEDSIRTLSLTSP